MSDLSIVLSLPEISHEVLESVHSLVGAINEGDAESFKSFDSKGWCDFNDFGDASIFEKMGRKNLRLTELSTYFEYDGFVAVLLSLGVEKIEGIGYSTDVDEYFFFNEKKEKDADLEEEIVAITGQFPGYNKKKVEAFVESMGGELAGDVDEETTLLMVGSNPDKKVLSEAKELGVRKTTRKRLDFFMQLWTLV